MHSQVMMRARPITQGRVLTRSQPPLALFPILSRRMKINAVDVSSQTFEEGAASSSDTSDLSMSEDLDAAIMERLIPTPPATLSSTAMYGYMVLHALHLLLGLGLLLGLAMAPHLLLVDDSVAFTSTAGATGLMLGIVACSFLRSAAILHFLVRSVNSSEMMTWRHSRLSLSLGVTSALAAVPSTFLALSPSAPLLPAALLAVLLPTSAFCLWTSFRALTTAELFCWTIDHTRPLYTLQKLSSCFLHGVSSLPGLICTALIAISCSSVVGLWPSGLAPLFSQYESLRLINAFSMIFSVFYFHEALEFCPWASGGENSPTLASNLILTRIQRLSRVDSALNPPPDRYLWMNLATLVAAASQSVLLSKAHTWEALHVINSDPMWGFIFYSTGLMLAYSVSLAAYLNYNSIYSLVSWVAFQVASVITFLFDNVIYHWTWQSKR